MSNKKTTSIPMCTILAVLFIVLKLANVGLVATWSWWWVLSPIWIPMLFFVIILIIALIIMKFN